MNARKRILAASLGLAGVVLPLAAAGTASADEGDGTTQGTNQGYGYDTVNETSEYPSTQSPLQPVNAVLGTADTTNFGFIDSLDTFSATYRPDGVNGTDTEIPQPDPRFVEGPAGGLLVNGPFE